LLSWGWFPCYCIRQIYIVRRRIFCFVRSKNVSLLWITRSLICLICFITHKPKTMCYSNRTGEIKDLGERFWKFPHSYHAHFEIMCVLLIFTHSILCHNFSLILYLCLFLCLFQIISLIFKLSSSNQCHCMLSFKRATLSFHFFSFCSKIIIQFYIFLANEIYNTFYTTWKKVKVKVVQ
jgi:hypothetical protein